MIRHHVAQSARRFVEIAALLDANRLRHRDLHMVDPIPIPDRFEQSICKAEGHDALDRILPEKMIDSENLILLQAAPDAGIQLAGRFQAIAEWLFNDDAAPETAFTLIGELRLAKLIHHGPEETIRNGKI